MAPEARTGRAPGKVILAGEHFVVYGVPALALPVPAREVMVTATRRPGPWRVAPQAREALRAMVEALGHDPDALTLSVEATLPFGAGLGGSAALAVALIRALGVAEPEEIRAQAHALERLAHGTPSGIDDAVATYASPVRFERGRPPEILDAADGEAAIWIARTPTGASTREAVERVRALSEARPQWFEARCDAARVAVDAADAALRAARWPALGAAMSDNHALLQSIGVSTPALDAVVRAALDAGAAGAKLTGGGLGGSVVILAPDAEGARGDRLERALLEVGALDVLRPDGRGA